jgi:hypothetical protein
MYEPFHCFAVHLPGFVSQPTKFELAHLDVDFGLRFERENGDGGKILARIGLQIWSQGFEL